MEKGFRSDILFSKYILEKCNIPSGTPKSSLFICTEVAFLHTSSVAER